MERSSASDVNAIVRPRWWIGLLLLVVGCQLWLIVDVRLTRRPYELLVLGSAVVLGLLPPVQRALRRAGNWLDARRGLGIGVIALLLFAMSVVYLYATAVRQDRHFVPIYHDEFSYQIQAQMLARGKLWMPAHELASFFDSFYLIVEPVYASMYFPGTAILLVPGVWLGLPAWVMPLLVSGAAVAVAFLLFREMLDTIAGMIAALLLVSLPLFRMLSIMSLSAMPALLLGMLVLWTGFRWRAARGSIGWLIAAGACSGMLAIIRPVDAVCFALPAWVYILLFSLRGATASSRVRALGILIAAAMPFAAIQLIFNRGVTGSWFQTPFGYYTSRDYPNIGFGFSKFDPDARPASALPQKQKFYADSVSQIAQRHTIANVMRDWIGHRWKALIRATIPEPLMVPFLLPGLLAVRTPRRIAALVVLALFVLLYSAYPFFIVHYFIILIPSFVLLLLLAIRVLPQLLPRFAPAIQTIVMLLLVSLAILALPELHRTDRDSFFNTTVHPDVNRKLAALEQTPAVVLFRFDENQSLEEEPVYNWTVAWPDDAAVVRAHDLGDRNIEIFRYYAKRQPQRAFYLYDRADGSIRYLGMAEDLAHGS